MAPPAKKNAKPIFKTSSPFTETHWPNITSEQQEVILDLLCELLQPLGDHRKAHVHPSKGKKRKRKSLTKTHGDDTKDADMQDAPPPSPEIGNHILVGLNTVTRHLEASAAKHAPSTQLVFRAQAQQSNDHGESQPKEMENKDLRPLTVLIIPHPHPPVSPAHSHLPTLVHLSTLHPSTSTSALPPSSPSTPSPLNAATRLIALSPISESRLSTALHIPRVGALGILEGAPGSGPLVDYVRQNIGVTECKWIDEGMRAKWRGVKVDVQTPKV